MPTPASFAASIAPAVIGDCINTGIFPSVVIAMAIQESGSGSSKQALMLNNLFGHAAGANYPGARQTVKGGRWWRSYGSIAEAIQAHIGILRSLKYRLAGVISARSPQEQAQALQNAGYDDGPDRSLYAAKLGNIIRSAGLQHYDNQLIAIERQRNKNGLAFHEQGAITKVLHSITG